MFTLKSLRMKNTSSSIFCPLLILILLYFQGKGLGTMLLDFAESLAREVEVEVVSIRDDLLAMYRKRGYKKISTLPITTRVPADQLTRPEVKLILMVKKEKE